MKNTKENKMMKYNYRFQRNGKKIENQKYEIRKNN